MPVWGTMPTMYPDRLQEVPEEMLGERPDIDPFLDDTPIEASCSLENPETCESCQ